MKLSNVVIALVVAGFIAAHRHHNGGGYNNLTRFPEHPLIRFWKPPQNPINVVVIVPNQQHENAEKPDKKNGEKKNRLTTSFTTSNPTGS